MVITNNSDNCLLNYTIIVMGPAYGTQSASTAYQFVLSVLNLNHRIESIFFYNDGVYNANQFTDPANDEFNMIKAWQTLAQKHNIKLSLCISAALRRGIIENKNVADGFVVSGLSDLSESLSKSDRVIQF